MCRVYGKVEALSFHVRCAKPFSHFIFYFHPTIDEMLSAFYGRKQSNWKFDSLVLRILLFTAKGDLEFISAGRTRDQRRATMNREDDVWSNLHIRGGLRRSQLCRRSTTELKRNWGLN